MRIIVLLWVVFHLDASVNWSFLLHDRENMTPVAKGASNYNYQYKADGSSYFVRYAPKKPALYADLAMEAKVLELLAPLDVSSKLLYYDEQNKALVTTFIVHENVEVDLLDPKARKEVIKLLHKIEHSSCAIDRVFSPYQDVLHLLAKSTRALPKEFYSYLPLLQKIDQTLGQDPYKTLCHLDLHHKNILCNQGRYWIIDWEYAAMSHPFLVLASMASIERWSDAQMRELLCEYKKNPSEADFERLYLYRIVADLFWTVWNHVQMSASSLDAPYQEWRDLFYSAAKERMQKLSTLEVLLLFGPPGSGKGTFSQVAIQEGYGHISAGDLLRDEVYHRTEVGCRIEEAMSKGDLVDPELILGLIKDKAQQYLAKGQSFIIDGYGCNRVDAAHLQDLIKEMNIPCRVILLESDDATCKKRILSRLICKECHFVTGARYREGDMCPACHLAPLEFRLNDTSEVIDKRLKQYWEESYPSYCALCRQFPSVSFATNRDLQSCLHDYEVFLDTIHYRKGKEPL